MSGSGSVMLTKFESKSNRVKGLAFHPTQPLLAAGLHNGSIQLWNYQHEGPVRAVHFHPSRALLVSGADDYKIKVWDIRPQNRRCLFTLHGHLDYIRTTQFHHEMPWIMTDNSYMNSTSRNCIAVLTAILTTRSCCLCSMDQTVRVWDISGLRKGNFETFDTFSTVKYDIKIWRMSETKAWEVDQCRGHFNNDKTIRVWDLAKRACIQTFRRENDPGHDSGLIVFKLERERPAFAVHQNTLYYVRDKYVRAYDFETASDIGLLSVRRFEAHLKDSGFDGKKGSGTSAIFVIEVRDTSNSVVKTIKPPVQTNDIFYGGTSCLILSSTSSVVLYDIQQQKTLAEINSPPVKYVWWNADNSLVALQSKHTITIATRNFTSHIRRMDDAGVFIYSTLNHIKYCSPKVIMVFICTLDNPVYLTRVKGKTIYCLDRSARPRTITFDPTEYRFKLALLKNNYEEMLYIIKTSTLLGQSIIAYLQQKGFPEYEHHTHLPIALHFVQDTKTRFELAIECGNLDVAIVEKAYQKTKNFDKLSFLYLATDAKIADARGNPMSRFHNALYAGDVMPHIGVEDVACVSVPGSYVSLAYLTPRARARDLAEEILEAAGLSPADVDDVPHLGINSQTPPVINPTADHIWPSLSTAKTSSTDEEVHEEIDPEEADGPRCGVQEEAEVEEELGAGATPGVSEVEHCRVLPVATRSLQSIRSEFAEGARDVAGNRLTNAQVTFRSVLRALLLLQPVHLQIALRSAITAFTKAKKLCTPARFAKRLLDLKPDAKVAAIVCSSSVADGERNHGMRSKYLTTSLLLRNMWCKFHGYLQRIPSVQCPYTNAPSCLSLKVHRPLTELTEIGAPASGLPAPW
ncbi:coatomer WD associated region-domain-containing protein [Rhodocollybia butyracea]|uniref:Coatomer WD associated region-domain-containing protein n=1 Tax=Rhodocollybia butyracea TaxID=206335 RepID=A0A9P5TW77_9AGAR|nr:coatomer WD associated region-domain-containing protein [Rhodocollybia butyracea]